jgi:predicted dienelactone hydrolase
MYRLGACRRVAEKSAPEYFTGQNEPSGAPRMNFLATALIFLIAVSVARADAVFKVGVTTRDFIPAEPYDWRGAKTRALRVVVWYPSASDAREEPQWIGPSIVPFVSAGSAARDVALAAGPRRPLIVLSHGSGGMASGLAWLGTALAAHGFIVVAVNHPGNNALEDYTVEGFSLWWLRAVDLSAVIGAMLDDKTFGSQIDPALIGAAGHSLGGYTVIAVAGGITEPARLQTFCNSPAADSLCRPPPADSDMRQKRLARLSSDPDFRQRYSGWDRGTARATLGEGLAVSAFPLYVPV